MDIKYLQFLQKLRESAPNWFNKLIQLITDTAGGFFIVIIPMIIFFCINKKKGEFVLLSLAVASVLNAFIKNIFCVYRPWMRSELIKPTAKAIKGAGGYSFPSGHTQGSASAFGSTAFVFRNKKLISILCVCLVLLVAFSRNYLGVHTPQDVLVGMLEAAVVIFLTYIIQKKTDTSEKRNLIFYCITVFTIVFATAFMCLKKYPIDHDIAGNVLIDPSHAISSFTSKAGLLIGALTAWMLEEKFIAFNTDDLNMKTKIVRFAIVAIVFLPTAIFAAAVSSLLPIGWLSAFTQNMILYFCVIFFPPLIFTRIETRSRSLNQNVNTGNS